MIGVSYGLRATRMSRVMPGLVERRAAAAQWVKYG
jgi:hypothetical protein